MSAYFQQDRDSFYLDQSARDSPCRVRFACEESLISLSKWNGEASLNLGTGGEHAGRLEVCRNEILLKPDSTRKTHHVFRKLDGERFEYDVILLKEPETNVIEIDLQFPDGLEFYRQPSFEEITKSRYYCAPEVIDSYAVYWKNRNGKYKTGKFCHIYRPLVYDARGRKVWGRLILTGRLMTITIPEDWLSEASYPVVVDPVIGTQTRGATYEYDRWGEGSPVTFYMELETGLNRFTASSAIYGTCLSSMYCYLNTPGVAGIPVLYSEVNSKPANRISQNEQNANFVVTSPRWVSSSFSLSRPVAAGETFWYGYCASEIYFPYIDFANRIERMYTDGFIENVFVPDPDPDTVIKNVLMSMYFTYTDAQNLTRIMLDTIGLTETLARHFTFRRACADGSGITETTVAQRGLIRECRSLADIADLLSFIQVLLRLCSSTLEAVGTVSFVQMLIRFCVSGLTVLENVARSLGQSRLVTSVCGFIEQMLGRMLLKKEELVFVSRVTREIEFRGYLL